MNKLICYILISTLLLCTAASYANVHTCPSITAIKQQITDKNLIEFKYTTHDGFGWSGRKSSDGIINFFGSFDTPETWVFHFDVQDILTQDELWNIFQNYLDTQPNVTRIAADHDNGYIDNSILLNTGRWTCRYIWGTADFGMGLHFYNVFAVLKAS